MIDKDNYRLWNYEEIRMPIFYNEDYHLIFRNPCELSIFYKFHNYKVPKDFLSKQKSFILFLINKSKMMNGLEEFTSKNFKNKEEMKDYYEKFIKSWGIEDLIKRKEEAQKFVNYFV